MDTERRAFIKKTCGLCASIVGITVLASALEGCASLIYVKPELVKGVLKVPLGSFVENSKLVIVRNAVLDYDIALVKSGDNTFRSFELKCTHQDNALVATSTGFFCNLHGSSFRIDGTVNVAPATANLKEYKTMVNGELVEIIL